LDCESRVLEQDVEKGRTRNPNIMKIGVYKSLIKIENGTLSLSAHNLGSNIIETVRRGCR
jgi:hypothetical protein